MTKSTKAKLAYMAQRQKSEEEVDKRVARNKARREAIREGVVKVGDNKEVDHKKMLDQGGSHGKSNTRVVSAEENRAWRKKNPKAYG
jgi:ferredoxin-fold anticodon binding domain-containing protein